MRKKRLLLVAYYFPPLGGAGVGRPLTLYRLLPKLGWECDLLTVKEIAYRAFEPELLDGVDQGNIYRSGSRDPQRLMRMLGIRTIKSTTIRRADVVSTKFFPDSKVGWIKPAVRLGKKLLSDRQYDLIMSTSPPVSTHLVAQRLAEDHRLPWVADFRDFWTSYKVEDCFADFGLVTKRQALLRQISTGATMLTAANSAIVEYIGAGHVIRNSYDERYASLWQQPVGSERFTIGLYGSFNDLCPVGPLLDLLSRLKETAYDKCTKVDLLQVGNVDQRWLKSQLEEHGLQNVCRMHPYRARGEAIKLMNEANLMYVGLSSKGEGIGRIFELLASGRPILAAVPPGTDLACLLEETGNSCCFDPSSIDRALKYLIEKIDSVESDRSDMVMLPEYARSYSAERMVAGFAELFDEIR